MPKFQGNYKGKKNYKKWWKLGSFLLKANPPLQNVCPIINCQHFYILSVERYVSPFLQKDIVQNVIKGIIILKV
jgi:hypothetical protein